MSHRMHAYRHGIALGVSLAALLAAAVIIARPGGKAPKAGVPDSGANDSSGTADSVPDGEVEFAATDEEVEALIRTIPDDHWMHAGKDAVLRKFKLPVETLRGHSSMFGGRMNAECWQVSESYWLELWHDYAFPDNVAARFHRKKPW